MGTATMPAVRRLGLPLILLAALATAPAALAHDVDPHHLPLGDGRISHAPKVGWIWACHVEPGGHGARGPTPWIDNRDHTYDKTEKATVEGRVRWPQHRFQVAIEGNRRVISFNDLPDVPTGQFPIGWNDPAHRFDGNPNRIMAQNYRIALPANPTLAREPSCAPPTVGVMIDGVLLLNALDRPGRDAVAHETQDSCQGHPHQGGVYHYHSLSSCIPSGPGPDGNSPLVGYALDGFGIYGPYEHGKKLSTADLDACHGRTSVIDWDGRKVRMYHYVATADFPYTVGCFRGHFDRRILASLHEGPMGRGGGQRRGGGFGGPPPGGRQANAPNGGSGGGYGAGTYGNNAYGGQPPANGYGNSYGGQASGGYGSSNGGPPPRGRRPDLAVAARKLGISENELRRALGPPPPRLDLAARRLGISESQLRQALGVP